MPAKTRQATPISLFDVHQDGVGNGIKGSRFHQSEGNHVLGISSAGRVKQKSLRVNRIRFDSAFSHQLSVVSYQLVPLPSSLTTDVQSTIANPSAGRTFGRKSSVTRPSAPPWDRCPARGVWAPTPRATRGRQSFRGPQATSRDLAAKLHTRNSRALVPQPGPTSGRS